MCSNQKQTRKWFSTHIRNGVIAFVGSTACGRLQSMISRRTSAAVQGQFGVKPLFYHSDGSNLIFASEMKVILGLLERHSVNVEAVRDYLAHCWLFYGENTFLMR